MPYRRKRKTVNKRTRREYKPLVIKGRSRGDAYTPVQYSNRTIVPRHTTPFPAKYHIKLVYTGWFPLATAGDGTNSYTSYPFKLNSCYDPYGGVSGSYNVQPYFWDQISAIYKSYVVTSAKIEVQWNRPQTTDVMVLLRPTNVSTLPSDFQLEESRPRAIKKQSTLYGPGIKTRAYYSVASVAGVTPQKVMNDDTFSALVGADPAQIVYAMVMNQNANGLTTSNSISMNVKLTQYVTMFDRTVVSGS